MANEANHHVNGYIIRETIRRWELRRNTTVSQFTDSLMAFPDEAKRSPMDIAADFDACEDRIVLLQMGQAVYNQIVQVTVLDVVHPLGWAVKRIGAAGRAEKMWRDAVTPKKDRYGYDGDSVRKDGEVRTVRTTSVEDCMKKADEAARFAGAIRAALSVGNGTMIPIARLGLDKSLFDA